MKWLFYELLYVYSCYMYIYIHILWNGYFISCCCCLLVVILLVNEMVRFSTCDWWFEASVNTWLEGDVHSWSILLVRYLAMLVKSLITFLTWWFLRTVYIINYHTIGTCVWIIRFHKQPHSYSCISCEPILGKSPHKTQHHQCHFYHYLQRLLYHMSTYILRICFLWCTTQHLFRGVVVLPFFGIQVTGVRPRSVRAISESLLW